MLFFHRDLPDIVEFLDVRDICSFTFTAGDVASSKAGENDLESGLVDNTSARAGRLGTTGFQRSPVAGTSSDDLPPQNFFRLVDCAGFWR